MGVGEAREREQETGSRRQGVEARAEATVSFLRNVLVVVLGLVSEHHILLASNRLSLPFPRFVQATARLDSTL